MNVHVTIEMDEAVKAKLDAYSTSRGRHYGDLLLEAAERIAREHDALEAAIVDAEASLAVGKGSPHEDVVARLYARRAKWTHAA